jgi:hypothetical protein
MLGPTQEGDEYTAAHLRNWMECIHSRKEPNACFLEVGYYNSVANIMANAAVHSGQKVTFDQNTQR